MVISDPVCDGNNDVSIHFHCVGVENSKSGTIKSKTPYMFKEFWIRCVRFVTYTLLAGCLLSAMKITKCFRMGFTMKNNKFYQCATIPLHRPSRQMFRF